MILGLLLEMPWKQVQPDFTLLAVIALMSSFNYLILVNHQFNYEKLQISIVSIIVCRCQITTQADAGIFW